MSISNEPPAREETFKSLSTSEAAAYAQHRHDYHPRLYNTLIERHVSTGGALDTLVDVGCGPGTAARALSPRFQHVIGLDPSPGMIEVAKGLGGASRTDEPIRFAVSSAEELADVPECSVDLLIAATAAHWFDMPAFWARAAQVLKPGGSVGLWTHRGVQLADDVPNAAAIRASLEKIQYEEIRPYTARGNMVSQTLYTDLPLPWTLETPVQAFDESAFLRVEWGTATEGALPSAEFFAMKQPDLDLDTMEDMMATASPVKRWRAANPEKVGTEQDVVRRMRREIERLLREAGVEAGQERIRRDPIGVLLVVKRAL